MAACALTLAACGSRSTLRLVAPADGGPDAAPIDGGIDAGVDAGNDPPSLVCEDVVTRPLATVPLLASYSGRGRPIRWLWLLTGQPDGSSARPPFPIDKPQAQFTPDLAGEYNIEVEVENDRGDVVTCALLVQAQATERLRIEMFWNPPNRSCSDTEVEPCDDSDVDLHLLHPDGDAWGNATYDCNWRNCTGGLAWDEPGEDDDAFLDLDDREGFGPENINVEGPTASGAYSVGVHYYSNGRSWNRASEVSVRIYCGGTDRVPALRVGPKALTADDVVASRSQFWRVADVTFTDEGCQVGVVDEVVTWLDALNAR